MIFSKVCFTVLLFAYISSSQGQVTNVTIEVEDLDRVGLRFLFNHGAATDSGNCTEADLTLINDALYSQVILSNRREKQMRSLPYYPPACRQLCAGYASGTCVVAGCKGYRRQMDEGEFSEVLFFESNGAITETSPSFLVKCVEEKEEASVVVSNLSAELSPSCQALLLEPMNVQCFMYLN